MSFLIYNPLEAMILILPLWILNKNNINWKNKKFLARIFIKDCYILGALNLIIQLPLVFLLESLFYTFYNCVISIGFMTYFLYKYNFYRFKKRNIILSILLLILYSITLCIILKNNSTYLAYIMNYTGFLRELLINLYARFVQILLIFIFFGGKFMLKKFFVKTSKENLKNSIASTLYAIGEPKISKKLKAEIKNSK